MHTWECYVVIQNVCYKCCKTTWEQAYKVNKKKFVHILWLSLYLKNRIHTKIPTVGKSKVYFGLNKFSLI